MFDIELKSVNKTYYGTDVPAVKDFDLAVEKGSVVTLLGPSGCGKTTTLRLIAGFERAEQGSIALAGKVVSDEKTWIPPEKRGLGMVFQDYALFPHLNVINNVGFGYRGKDLQQRIKEVLELVNLTGYEIRYPNELSGGQQQRVALARALARRPVVILLDEPFSNLDVDLRSRVRAEVRRIIKEAGATAVFVSHDQKDALAISDNIVVMKDGIVQQKGTPREIYQFPKNRFVATFVGETNILEGRIGNDGSTVLTELGSIPCKNIKEHSPGEKVSVSVRPDSLELDEDGYITGQVKESTYTGESINAVIEVEISSGRKYNLLTHIHPEKVINSGDIISFKVLPDFVSIIYP